MRLYVETNFICTSCDPLDGDYRYCSKLIEQAEKGIVEIVLPRMSVLESEHVFEPRRLSRLRRFNELKKTIRNGRRAGISEARKIDLADLTRNYHALLKHLEDPRPTLERIQRVSTVFEPDADFDSTLTSVTSALTTGLKDKPFAMTEMDRLIFAAIVHFDRSSSGVDPRLFCTRDNKLVQSARSALTLIDHSLDVTSSFGETFRKTL